MPQRVLAQEVVQVSHLKLYACDLIFSLFEIQGAYDALRKAECHSELTIGQKSEETQCGFHGNRSAEHQRWPLRGQQDASVWWNLKGDRNSLQAYGFHVYRDILQLRT